MNKYMDSELVDLMGKTIVSRARDDVISSLDKAIRGTRLDIYSKKIHSITQPFDLESKKILHDLIPFIVDATIEVFLQMLDHENEAELRLVSERNGNFLIPEICLEAEYSFSAGWVKRFSKERENKISKEAVEEFDATYKPSLKKKISN